VSFYVSTATFFLLHYNEWDRVVALPRHKFVTGATLLQLGVDIPWVGGSNTMGRERVQYILIIMGRGVIKFPNFQKI
jgi:hypothetical protein